MTVEAFAMAACCVIAGLLAAAVTYRYLTATRADVQVRIGGTVVTVRIGNSPFDARHTQALVLAAAHHVCAVCELARAVILQTSNTSDALSADQLDR